MSFPPEMPIQPIKELGTRTTNQSGKEIELYAQGDKFSRDLLSILNPGDVLHGRVVEQFDNGAYLFTIRGRNMIASSSAPLMRDSVYAFEVLQTKNGLHIRLINPAAVDQAQTSNVESRLQRLNLPLTTQSQLVLHHFEQAGAPLNSDRLQQALQAVNQAPADQQKVLAASFALLAKHNVPATPALLSLAHSSITQSGQSLQQLLPQLSSILPSTHSSTGQTQAAGLPQAALPPIPSSTTTTTTGAGTFSNSATAQTHIQAQAHIPNQSTPAPAANLLAPGLPTTQYINQQISINPKQLEHNPAFLLAQSRPLALHTVVDVERSLLQNNIRPQAALASEVKSGFDAGLPLMSENRAVPDHAPLKSLVQELAQLSQILEHQGRHETTNEAIKQVVRELSAETILKPQHLNDYDSVLPLVLQHQGQTQQARLAIAKRPIPGQQMEATFLRVELELQQLGPLSLRMSSGHGPIVITIFATGPALSALEAALPDLQHDLVENHVEAHIRIGDLLEHQESSYG